MDLFNTGSITLSDISRSTGISLSHVSRIMRGKRQPSLENASKLAAYLGVTVEELIHNLDAANGADIPPQFIGAMAS